MKRCFREKVVHIVAGLVVRNLFGCASVTELDVSLVDDGIKIDPKLILCSRF